MHATMCAARSRAKEGFGMPGFETQIITGFQTLMTWIAGLAIPGTGAVLGWHALMRGTAQDEMTAQHHSRAMRSAVIFGGLTIIGGALVSALLGLFF